MSVGQTLIVLRAPSGTRHPLSIAKRLDRRPAFGYRVIVHQSFADFRERRIIILPSRPS